MQLHVLFTTASQLLLKWTVMSRGSSLIQGYVIRYSLSADSPWIKQLRISPSVTFYLMRDLTSSTTYYVELQAIDKYFTSEPSVVEVTTQESGRFAICYKLHVVYCLHVRYTVIEINSEIGFLGL